MSYSESQKLKELQALTAAIGAHSDVSFYNTVWKTNASGVQINSLSELPSLPLLSRSHLYSTPFRERLYKDDKLLTKITHPDGENPLLIARGSDDIQHEGYGIRATRPLVLFDSGHEGLEKSLWYYEQNVLPLINETNHAVTAMIAAKYEIDAITTTTETLRAFLPHLAEHYSPERIKNVSIVDTRFSLSFLKKLLPKSDYHLVLALPEAGTIATACPEHMQDGNIVFHPHPTSIVEIEDKEIILSRVLMLPTPIIRYKTTLYAQWYTHSCSCNSSSFILI